MKQLPVGSKHLLNRVGYSLILIEQCLLSPGLDLVGTLGDDGSKENLIDSNFRILNKQEQHNISSPAMLYL